ncbi:DUF4190 domain-containing protein [Paenarthrobacter aurescens]|uniref:DUF4190 domain-containing protein n=1 Tax=Paenarthrobacter aurescens TaxID=43663 RepID=A0A4Y3NHR4_PAEAU|nr:DUF4190 domain-containing protein [Paenarthrobacter aurescens]MDO6142489.1 DUF4190 domain-containing protein [Paenarthrobacter aurescens]MDO6146336.1 DUF4190 domain-containing protein [Paenarthrobacter aurescens]MDO6157581.1 DUF4190 domain-containing protein [Paenarthrobacter aurescens]MDO6161566.1 DUF4190 domain-containing protein [Paenarthrobacter aurescens]GEB20753.1 hypothetical protein AAU01_35080 [Paenarthrobacter aurescens]
MSVSSTKAPPTTGRINLLAMAAIALGALAFAGIWFFGLGILATFAVGAGHVSLNQIRRRNERGRTVAILALILGYGLATWALLNVLTYIPVALEQMANQPPM